MTLFGTQIDEIVDKCIGIGLQELIGDNRIYIECILIDLRELECSSLGLFALRQLLRVK